MNAIMRLLIIFLIVLFAQTGQSQEIGDRCFPGERSDRPGITCQVTEEIEYVAPYIQNARKGDVILSPAGDGIISKLLRSVNPPQKYSHSGIMVENFTTIRHCTASEKYYRDHANSNGFNPLVLKYGWPGTITMSVYEAFEGKTYISPSGKPYFLSGFSTKNTNHPDEPGTIYPAVVKPFIQYEYESLVRNKLEGIAEAAKNINGHYRFYAYSNADIIDNSNFIAPSQVGWAHPEYFNGLVCSSFIWYAAKRAGVSVEDEEFEITDRGHPLNNEQTGLYVYSEQERREAANTLYTEIYNLFYEKAGWFGEFLTDASHEAGNQIVNTFAFDWSDRESYIWKFSGDRNQQLRYSTNEPSSRTGLRWHAKDSNKWRDPGYGIAIAPDDIAFNWDSPPQGVYGIAEELIYRPGRYIRVHRWARSEGTGDVVVNVRYGGRSAEAALVTIEGIAAEYTDSSGRVQFSSIPGGNYSVKAEKNIADYEFGTNIELSTSAIARVISERVTTLNLDLSSSSAVDDRQPSDTSFRRLIAVSGSIYIRDDENMGKDVVEKRLISGNTTKELNPLDSPRTTFKFVQCTGGEVRVEAHLSVELNRSDLSAMVYCTGKLFEGSSCRTTSLRREKYANVNVPKNESRDIEITLLHDEDVDDTRDTDVGIIRLTIGNIQARSN